MNNTELELQKAMNALRKIAEMAGSHTVSVDIPLEEDHPAGYRAIYHVATTWRNEKITPITYLGY